MNIKECIEFLESERDKYYALEITRMDYFTKQKYDDVISCLKLLGDIRKEKLVEVIK